MTDMRNFTVSEEIRPLNNYAAEPYSADSIPGNDALGAFHTVEAETGSNTGRAVGALAVALLIGTAGVFAFQASQHQTAKPAERVAAATPPAMAPAPAQTAEAAPSPYDAAPAPLAEAAAPAPTVKTPAATRTARTDRPAAVITAPVQAEPQPATQPDVPQNVTPVVPDQQAAAQPAVNPAASNPAASTPEVQPQAAPEPVVEAPQPAAPEQPAAVPPQAAPQ